MFNHDYHSFSNLEDYTIECIDLRIEIDFLNKVINGQVDLYVEKTGKTSNPLVLDSRDLNIRDMHIDGNKVEYDVGDTVGLLGEPLIVYMPCSGKLTIHYSTSPDASGLQWLTPIQENGKNHPFLFTQSQPIHTRSFIPLQDTPQAKITYTSYIKVPTGMIALMGTTKKVIVNDGTFVFCMENKVPPYLIAIVVGELVYRSVSDTIGIYAEREKIDSAYEKYLDIENILKVAEKICGPYQWHRYDLLIMPKCYPYGGMEIPTLNMITSTDLFDENPTNSLLIHEMSHSWSGNLVTNSTWDDLWINEGVTTYITNRIIEKIYGKSMSEIEMAFGYNELLSEYEKIEDKNDGCLSINIGARDPDEIFTNIPYQKGALLLYEIEQIVGRDIFDGYLKKYFMAYSYKCINSEEFIRFFTECHEMIEEIRLRQWVYESGLPKGSPVINSNRLDLVDYSYERWMQQYPSPIVELRANHWSSYEWKYFIEKIQYIDLARLEYMDKTYSITKTTDSDILCAWLVVALRNKYTDAYPRIREFAIETGRIKHLAPVYAAMIESDNRIMASKIFSNSRSGYHPILIKIIESIIGSEIS